MQGLASQNHIKLEAFVVAKLNLLIGKRPVWETRAECALSSTFLIMHPENDVFS
jgi:hypothetical protein